MWRTISSCSHLMMAHANWPIWSLTLRARFLVSCLIWKSSRNTVLLATLLNGLTGQIWHQSSSTTSGVVLLFGRIYNSAAVSISIFNAIKSAAVSRITNPDTPCGRTNGRWPNGKAISNSPELSALSGQKFYKSYPKSNNIFWFYLFILVRFLAVGDSFNLI